MSPFSRRRHRQSGYVLLLVLGLTVLILLGAAAIYTSSDSNRMAFGQVRAQAVALARAQEGAQQTVARLRGSRIVLTSPTLACPTDTVLTGCDSVYTTFNMPETGDPEYQIIIYQRTISGFSRSSTIVSSMGLSGALTSPNLATARVEVEVQTPVTSTMGNNIAGGS